MRHKYLPASAEIPACRNLPITTDIQNRGNLPAAADTQDGKNPPVPQAIPGCGEIIPSIQ